LELSAPLEQILENTKLICSALDRISLQVEDDPEQCLNFLVDCRANFPNWDLIQRWTIKQVQSLTLNITRKVKFSSSRAAFLQGCLANLFVRYIFIVFLGFGGGGGWGLGFFVKL